MKNHERETDPVQYLENVLETWKGFCKGHPQFTRVIRKILEENKMLKQELKKKGN
jgi:hypothetical protein